MKRRKRSKHLEVPELPRRVVELLCAAGAEGGYGILEEAGKWWITWHNSVGRQFRVLAGSTRDSAADAMAALVHKSGHSMPAFAREVASQGRPSETCHGVYYTDDGKVWRLAGQYRTIEMAAELVANMTIDAMHRGLDRVKIQRFELLVEYGKAPKIKKNPD